MHGRSAKLTLTFFSPLMSNANEDCLGHPGKSNAMPNRTFSRPPKVPDRIDEGYLS